MLAGGAGGSAGGGAGAREERASLKRGRS